jgi:hypothetical protein
VSEPSPSRGDGEGRPPGQWADFAEPQEPDIEWSGCTIDAYDWICTDTGRMQRDSCSVVCDTLIPELLREPEQWSVMGRRVKYCLSIPRDEECRLNYNVYLAIGVVVANLFKALVIAYLALSKTHSSDPALITIGDAISSFLQRPDETASGLTLASAKLLRLRKKRKEQIVAPLAIPWDPQRGRLHEAVSPRRWTWTIVV